MASEALGLGQLVTLGLGSGLVSACASQVLSHYLSNRSNEKEAAYTALRAAIQLEEYVANAAQTLSDWRGVGYFDVMEEREQGHETSRASFPRFDGFVGDLEWRHVDSALSSRALAFANETKAAGEWISGLFDFDDEDGLFEMQVQAALRGTRAAALAADLRRRYSLPAFTTDGLPWDYMTVVRERQVTLQQEVQRKMAHPLVE